MFEAEKMLRIAKRAWENLERTENVDDFHMYWIAAVTALRAVGHILHKVDEKDPRYRDAIQSWWKALQADKRVTIFHEFIERERNFTIKEYVLNFQDYSHNIVYPNFETGEWQTTSGDDAVPDLLFVPMIDGPYEGEDCRDIISKAIDWWTEQLDLIRRNSEK